MSEPGLSQPPPKRRRTNIKKAHTMPQGNPTRSTTFWFNDGTIILEVQDTQFRVHQTFLSSNSGFFKTLQPEIEAVGEGCPVVHMKDDEVEDWANMLNAMYCPMKIQPLGIDLSPRQLVSLLRLGKKYRFGQIYSAALTRLKAEFPQTFPNFEKIFNVRHRLWDCSAHGIGNHCRPLICQTWSLFDLVNIAVELGIKSVLPAAFLLCLVRSNEVILNGSPRPDGTIATLAQNPFLLRMILSRDQIRTNARNLTLNWLYDDEPAIPSSECTDEWSCLESCLTMIKTIEQDASSFLAYAFLRPDDSIFDSFCEACIQAKDENPIDLLELWNQLPSCFGLPEWKELVKSLPK